MTTNLQNWGNSQGIRVPKVLLAALGLEKGAEVELMISPEKDALIVRPAKRRRTVRGRHRIEDLVKAMPRARLQEVNWGTQGGEVW